MHGVRLDPFSSRLLAIRLKNPQPACDGPEDAPELEPEPELAPTEATATIDAEEVEEPYMPTRSAPDARAPTGAPVGQVTAELMADATRVVAPTDCHTCGQHDVPQGVLTLQQLTEELNNLKARMSRAEEALLIDEDGNGVYQSLSGS
jgi:hypothetical protein